MEFYWHLYVLAMLFFTVGIFHFIKPGVFMRVMPNYLPAHKFLVFASGVLELVAATGLMFNKTQIAAAWLMIVLLLSFIPVHVYMITNKKAGMNLPKGILYFRLLFQAFLIIWAYQYTSMA
jgi:uncharacterized membrane protein